MNFEEEMSLTRDLMDELKAEIAASPDPLATAIERPADGMCARAHRTKARHNCPHCVCVWRRATSLAAFSASLDAQLTRSVCMACVFRMHADGCCAGTSARAPRTTTATRSS